MAERAPNVTPFPGQPDLMPRARSAASIEPTTVEWLSPGRLAVGKITIIDGDPGLGKSQITLDWAARISRGEPLPGSEGWPNREPITMPRNVLLISSEDGESDTIRPRLDAAGADPRRVFVMDMVDEAGNKFLPMLGKHLWAIERQIEATGAAMLVVDPLFAHLDPDVKSNNDQDVRRVLSPMASMAERAGCAILVLRHLNKAQGIASLYRGGGSIGIVGAARIALLVHKDTDDESGVRRLLMVQKANVGREAETLAYQIDGDGVSGMSHIQWLGYSTKTVDGVMGQPLDRMDREDASEAEEWLRDMLASGPVSSTEIMREATKAGFRERALKRAKSNIGAKVQRHGFGKEGQWQWHIPHIRTASGNLTPRIRTADDPFDDD
jgi:putative DNA primase/helicase